MTAELVLGEVCGICAHQVDPTAPEFRDLPHVSAENIQSGCGRLLAVQSAHDDGMKSGKYLFEPGDVLYSKLRPYLRKAVVAPFRGLCSADMYPLRVRPELADAEWLMWVLLSASFTRYANEQSGRARMPKLNRRQLLSWRLRVPPVADQRRDVLALRGQLAAVERGRVAAEARLEACDALIEASLRDVFGGDLGGRWTRRRVADICEIQLGKMLSPKSKTGARPRPYLRNANVQWNHFELADVAEMDFSEREEEKFTLRRGDLLVCEGGEPGRSAVWQGQISRCCYQKAVHRLRPIELAIDPLFLMYRFWYGALTDEFSGAHAKTTIAHLPAVRLAELAVGVPSLIEQHAIVERLNDRLDEVARLRASVAGQLEVVSALPSALLRLTFSGTL